MYQHIMVPMDGSKLAECVLPHVEAVAGISNTIKVTLVRVVEPLHLHGGVESGFMPEERQRLEDDATDIARSYLDNIARQLKDKGTAAEFEVLHGGVIEKLSEYANKHGVDLIIISTHGHSGIGRLVWGNVADRVLRSVHAPVFMVRAPGCAVGD